MSVSAYRLKHLADLAVRKLLRRAFRNDNAYLSGRHVARLLRWALRRGGERPSAPEHSRLRFKAPRYRRVDPKYLAESVSGLDFTVADRPVVSIVIPSYGNPRYLAECLLSLASNADPLVPAEVVVADDCSPGRVNDFVGEIPGLRYSRNERNLGFIRNCNRAAEDLSSPIVVFLNSDVVVFKGWLAPMIRQLLSDPRVGAVAPMLLNDDGSLQESGARLDEKLRPERLGHMGYPEDPAYQSTIDVDYCSGACLMTRLALFRSVGGFSEYLRGAYWDDVDYCLKIRAAGAVVRRVPSARVLHHENASYTPGRHRKLIAANYETLLRVWKGVPA